MSLFLSTCALAVAFTIVGCFLGLAKYIFMGIRDISEQWRLRKFLRYVNIGIALLVTILIVLMLTIVLVMLPMLA